jgi:ATP-dependent Clp protease ATP-binding subunit ClpB
MDATREVTAIYLKKDMIRNLARPKRVIQRDVLMNYQGKFLSGKIITDSIVLIDAFDGKTGFRNQTELVSFNQI